MNLTLAHERTHRQCRRNEKLLADDDKDGVPDVWEDLVPGMRHRKKDPATNDGLDSFGDRFNISVEGGRGKRDEEFYATLGGALGGEDGTDPYFGRITKGTITRAQYFGKLPVKAKLENDWSKGGANWQK